MTLTRRGSGYALNGDGNELTEVLALLEHYIVDDARWAHNAKQHPAMVAKAAGYRKLRERLAQMQSQAAKEVTAEFFGKTYTASATRGDDGIYVRIFHEGKQVSPEYAVTDAVGADLMDATGINAVDNLIKMALKDLEENLKRQAQRQSP